MKGRLSVINFSSENNLPTFRLNAPVVIRVKELRTGAFSQNVSKLFSELKLVTDNLFVLQKPTEKPLKVYLVGCIVLILGV